MKFKIIHKSCELNFSQILKNFFTGSASNVEVQEDNLLDVAICREAFVENILDKKYCVNKCEKIIFLAKSRIGETSYDIVTDNCQHFCTSVRYGVAVSLEIEETTLNGFFFD